MEDQHPNWLEMPDDLITNILQRLPTKEILDSARKVCTTWRRICNNTLMWKVIVMHRSYNDWKGYSNLERLTKQAVDLSCGELIDISIEGFGTNELLHHIVLHSCKLKRLSLICCYSITGSGLSRAVKRVPQLEELHISRIPINTKEIKVIGQNCPQLKSFTMHKELGVRSIKCDGNALAIANNMPELRYLELSDYETANDGLEAILNGCPHLQTLDVRMCGNLKLKGNLRTLCMARIKDFKHARRWFI